MTRIKSLSDILTVPDESIIGESSVDPLGMQKIWTFFGQKVFANKLTTVSTDIRNFTINLFHHHVLHRLERDRREAFVTARSKFSGYKSDYDVKAGLLMFMEDLLVYSLMNQAGKATTLGLLGSYNADQNLFRHREHNIPIIADKEEGVLVRQIQLGVNGRYKGPFIRMNLFRDRQFGYNDEEWTKVGRQLKQWKQIQLLADRLLDILVNLIENSSGAFPNDLLLNYSKDAGLWKLYLGCFGQNKINPALKTYWEDRIGLNEGAAHAIYSQFKEGMAITPKPLIEKARKELSDEDEKEKLTKILKLEPFLSGVNQVFNLLLDPGARKVDDLKKDVQLILKDINLAEVRPLAHENSRLKFLITSIESAGKSPSKFIRAVTFYHEQIMKNRGGSPWVEIQDGVVKHYIHRNLPISTKEFLETGYWYHRYYTRAVHSIYQGLNLN